MILVDMNIKQLLEQNGCLEDYDISCITNIGYDLRAKYFVVENDKKESVLLKPWESVFVASVEVLTVPRNMLCRVVLKNSRIRQGLTFDSPVYQPGHKTRVYFRLTNISKNELQLVSGEKYGMLIFEQLIQEPENLYAGAFSDELDFLSG